MEKNLSTLKGIFNYSTENFSDREAYAFVGEKGITYAGVADIAGSLQFMLESMGVKPGDRVAIFSQNMPNWSIAYFAIAAMGAVVVPILPDFTLEEVNNILNHSDTSALLISESLFLKHEGFEKAIPVIKLEDFSVFPGTGEGVQYNPEKKSTVSYTVDPEDLAAIIYTSGTTGQSKGVMLLHRNICSNVDQGKNMQEINENDRFLSLVPLSHTLENTVGMLIPFVSGSKVNYLRKPPTAPVLP